MLSACHQPLIIFDIDQAWKSEVKKGILVFELPVIFWSSGHDQTHYSYSMDLKEKQDFTIT